MSERSELVLPWLPAGRVIRIDGRGELFVRVHEHSNRTAPTVLLLHGWTASSDLQFFTAYEALAERYSFVGIDHRGHGRGLRSPAPFRLEDAADDAAAVIGELGIAPVVAVGYSMGGPISLHLARRHPALVRGLVVQATALEWTTTWRERALWRVLPVFGSWLRSRGYRWYLNKAVPKLIGAGHPMEPYVPWLLSEMARNDPFAMVDAGRALSAYDARPWVSTLEIPAGSLITTRDRLVGPGKQRALAAALGATVRELRSDHFAALADPAPFAALTVELVDEVVRAAQPHLDGRRAPVAGCRLIARQLVEPLGEQVDRVDQVVELIAELLAGDDVGEHHPDAGDLPGEELGVGGGALGDGSIDLPLGAVPRLLAVLGEQDERCRVRGLQREDEGQQHETAIPGVELEAFGEQQVVGDPEADDERLPHQEPGRAEEAGDRLGETTEHVRLVLDRDPPAAARFGEILPPLHHDVTLPIMVSRRPRPGGHPPLAPTHPELAIEHVIDRDRAEQVPAFVADRDGDHVVARQHVRPRRGPSLPG